MLLSYRKVRDPQHSILGAALSAARSETGPVDRRKNYPLRRLYGWLGNEARERLRESAPAEAAR